MRDNGPGSTPRGSNLEKDVYDYSGTSHKINLIQAAS